ncbi:DUF3667 domain-containing protein [Sphingomonas sp. RB56-2]|uniref:DUF3667 domain-containing protein n=1 Tax=Sphingomonas brevis TaxID=2908206 RepID=A0ABT0SCB3_9SPHN|nr:DUF3667 domain-containing protein [Sphingomonas brevis]MCL6742037.1 DUF3667 domain-containing protein [Sphingomonas brevis]
MGELEGIGEAVTGGLLARAVEPAAGEAGDDGHTHENNCLNCGASLNGPYCSACGQKAHIHRSLRAFMGDFVAGLLNFEGKFWRTLPMLAWCPGDLTRRYIAGERARFISPVALYLFSVFLMFAVLNSTGAIDPDTEAVKSGVSTAVKEERAKIIELEMKRTAAKAAGQNLAAIDRKIAEENRDLAHLQRVQNGQVFQTDLDDSDQAPGWVKEAVKRGQENPELMVTGIQDAASKYSWLLIPFSAPFLWLLFPMSRRYRLYDHTVFVTYSLSFMMMLVIAGGLLVAGGYSGLASMLFFIPPIHMYRQLKGAYSLSRTSAVLRTFALVTFSFIAGTLFFLTAVAIGVL